MFDFLMISYKSVRNNTVEIYPKFIVKKSNDLMIRGGDFYAIWVEERGLWSTSELDAIALIDRELDRYAEENKSRFEMSTVRILHMWDSETRMIDAWHRYCQRDMRDSYHSLDDTLIFANTETTKKDYASKRLPYPLESGPIDAYDHLMSVLYSEEERHKIEWAIGSIVEGDSKDIQKFLVLYGAAGTGKSTVLNIIQQLFDGYYATFDAKALGSANAAFALEPFKANPLVAIQHDGDLSRIEDNTRLNSLVSHELMTVNEKHKSLYSNKFKCFLFMGTNKPVKITDAKSGLIRRLIDVSPTGDKLSTRDYNKTMKQISFELGAIADHCHKVYLEDPSYFNSYVPLGMLDASNDFYNFVMDYSYNFEKEKAVKFQDAWAFYKVYCDEAKLQYPFVQRVFREELKNYFKEYKDRYQMPDGTRVRGVYIDFKSDLFDYKSATEENKEIKPNFLDFREQDSIFDIVCKDCPAQYASAEGSPRSPWDKVETVLSNIDSHMLHYVRVPYNHIVVDFDIPDENGNKCLERNLAAASSFPPTYAELSKSGAGIHLHYIYSGDPSQLSHVYDDHIEIKVFTGKSALRRLLTKCNNLPIATITSGLPLKGDKKMVSQETIKNEKHLRVLILRNLEKEYLPGTKPSIDFIAKLLQEAYDSGMNYDVRDLYSAVLAFAMHSTHNRDYCIKKISEMKFVSERPSAPAPDGEAPIVFYDIEVFPNLLLINYKFEGQPKVFRLINPSPEEASQLFKYRLVGFNCRKYDNHILWARAVCEYTNQQLYELSQDIIANSSGAFFGEAYNLSYTDIYDFSSEKKSLKKFEIELGIHHQELGLPWDKPVPEEKWNLVAEYCDNDVIATEAVWRARQSDFLARQILASLTGSIVNDTTNSLSAKLIFGSEKNPQREFNYRDLSKPVRWSPELQERFGQSYKFRVFDEHGDPLYQDFVNDMNLPEGYSVLPFWPEYRYEHGTSYYFDEIIGEGGAVYAEHGMHGNVDDEDVSSMHPHSTIAEVLFGPRYTKIFEELVEARVAIKHKDFKLAKTLLNGKLAPFLNDESKAADLAQALKIVINSVYGLTAASFTNKFRDPRNVDNIVAKRGALFISKLRREVQKRGFKVCHIKTDSIKIPDATPEIIEFVRNFGKEYGYSFETEAVFDRMCLVNDAVYIAKYKTPVKDKVTGKDIWWVATGKQFAVPYVFKTLFSHEPILFEDMCETMSVTSAIYLDMNEDEPDPSDLEKQYAKLCKEAAKRGDESLDMEIDILGKQIADRHHYQFVGRVGLFCPIVPGGGGGVLYREKDGKYYSLSGTKGYRWLEAETVKANHLEHLIDKSYYQKLVDDAIETLAAYGDYNWFVSDSPYVSPNYIDGHPVYPDYEDVN